MHFILDCEPGWPIRQGPDVDEPWTEGQKLMFPPDEPLRYTIEPQVEGEPASMYEGLAPVWSEDLVAALREAGVHNLESFPAIVQDPTGRREWSRYRAVNVVGRVAAVDLKRSGLTGDEEERGDLDPENFVLDERAAAPFRLFRLAESPDLVIVDDQVRVAVERRGVPGVRFRRPGPEEE